VSSFPIPPKFRHGNRPPYTDQMLVIITECDRLGWTDADIAIAANVSLSSVRRWRRGDGKALHSKAVLLVSRLNDAQSVLKGDGDAPRCCNGSRCIEALRRSGCPFGLAIANLLKPISQAGIAI